MSQWNQASNKCLSSMYHSLSQSACLCRLVSRDINVTFVKHGCSWYSDSNYTMSDVSLSQSACLCRLVGRDINVTFVKHGCSWYSDSNYTMSDVDRSIDRDRDRDRERERERNACQVMDDSMMSNPRRVLRHAQCLFSYFLIYLTMWLKPLFKWKGENLTNLHILWKFYFCNVVLACYGFQKWQNRFGVNCKSSHSSNSGGFSPVLYR